MKTPPIEIKEEKKDGLDVLSVKYGKIVCEIDKQLIAACPPCWQGDFIIGELYPYIEAFYPNMNVMELIRIKGVVEEYMRGSCI